MVDLSSYTAVRTSSFVRLQIDDYRTTSSGTYTNQVLRFSDHYTDFTIDGETYTPLGELLAITASTSELRPSSNTISISLSGIPTDSISEILYSRIKGAPVEIYRAFFDISTNAQIGSTVPRYIGSINNYSLEEEIDSIEKTATNTIQFECLSNVDILSEKVSGRRTNPKSMKSFYSNDVSFDRVPNLIDTNFDFGVAR